jgi:hypothetical protein
MTPSSKNIMIASHTSSPISNNCIFATREDKQTIQDWQCLDMPKVPENTELKNS